MPQTILQMGPEELCFRLVRLSVRVVRTCVRACCRFRGNLRPPYRQRLVFVKLWFGFVLIHRPYNWQNVSRRKNLCMTCCRT